jgi:hypothetical protein
MVSYSENQVLRQLSCTVIKTTFVMVCNEENRVLCKLSRDEKRLLKCCPKGNRVLRK